MPGYSLERFTVPVSSEFICSICLDVLRDALYDSCDHFFCSECIHNWLQSQDSDGLPGICPISKQALVKGDLLQAPRIVRNLLSNLTLACTYRKNGCNQAVTYGHIDDHEKQCQHRPWLLMSCEHGCGATFLSSYSAQHFCLKFLRKSIESLVHSLDILRDVCDNWSSENSNTDERYTLLCSFGQENLTQMEEQFNAIKSILVGLNKTHSK